MGQDTSKFTRIHPGIFLTKENHQCSLTTTERSTSDLINPTIWGPGREEEKKAERKHKTTTRTRKAKQRLHRSTAHMAILSAWPPPAW